MATADDVRSPRLKHHDDSTNVPNLKRPSWWASAACLGSGTDLWFVENGSGPGTGDEAKTICRGCPVRDECLEWVLVNFTNADDHGIWGGTDAKQRKKMRRERGLTRDPEKFCRNGHPRVNLRTNSRGYDECLDCRREQKDREQRRKAS